INDSSATTSVDFWQGRRVLVTGAHGFIGQNLVAALRRTGCELILPTRTDYDLLEQNQVRLLFRETKPEIVFQLAGLVGGILANKERPADFCYENLLIGALLLH